MSLTVTQTSAARVVRGHDLTENDVKRLIDEFGVHPFDAERLARVPDRSVVDHDHQYVIAALILPWPSTKGVVGIDIQLVLAPKLLIVIGDTPVRTIFEACRNMDTVTQGTETVVDLMIHIISNIAAGLATLTVRESESLAVRRALGALALALSSFVSACEAIALPVSPDARQEIAFASHRIKSVSLKTTPTELTAESPIRQKRIAIGYAAASAAILLVTLLLRP